MQAIFDNHNLIKDWLIGRALSGQPGATVMDLGVGKLGDLFKYKSHNIARLIGIDNNPEHLAEARRRLCEHPVAFQRCVSLLLQDLTAPPASYAKTLDALVKDDSLDLAVANFSLHYLFRTKDIIVDSLKMVVRKLKKPGGQMIGTTVNGDAVLQLLSGGGGGADRQHFKNDLFELSIAPQQQDGFGRQLNMSIAESIIDDDHKSKEFLVTQALLKTVASEAGLELTQVLPFDTIASRYGSAMRRPLHVLHADQACLSHLNMAFVLSFPPPAGPSSSSSS